MQRRDAVHDGHDEQHGMRGDAVSDAREKCVGEEELTSGSLGVRRDAVSGGFDPVSTHRVEVVPIARLCLDEVGDGRAHVHDAQRAERDVHQQEDLLLDVDRHCTRMPHLRDQKRLVLLQGLVVWVQQTGVEIVVSLELVGRGEGADALATGLVADVRLIDLADEAKAKLCGSGPLSASMLGQCSKRWV